MYIEQTTKTTPDQLGFSFVHREGGISEYRLNANGLQVLLSENHIAPVVNFMQIIRVGSRNEATGWTGSTHFLEHMMFKGTDSHNPANGQGVTDLLKRVGAVYNATTSFDRTNYFECAPAGELELCVRLEADRLRNLRLQKSDRDSEMTVVRNEFERGENSPDSVMHKAMYANAYQAHPYRITTIGLRDDVENVPMERMKAFYDDYYWPNNTTVFISGDFDPANALTLVSKHYSSIPASPHPIPAMYTTEPPQEGERRFKIRRAGELPLVWVGYHVPNAQAPDNHAREALCAILGHSGLRSSRLYKALVETGMASQCFASHAEQRDPGLIIVGATLTPGTKPESVEKVLLKELALLSKEPVAEEELRRAKNANRKGIMLAKADPVGLANMVAQAVSVADWTWLTRYEKNFDAVSPMEIKQVAQSYFTEDNCTVGYFLPTKSPSPRSPRRHRKEPASAVAFPGAADDTTKPETETAPGAASTAAASTAARRASFAGQTTRAVLPNGLTVLIMPNRGTGTVAVTAKVRAGAYYAGANQRLVAALTADMIARGSAKYSKLVMAEMLEDMGTSLGFGASNFTVDIYRGGSQVIAADLGQFLTLLSDVLRHPLFLDSELDKARKEMSAHFVDAMQDTEELAKTALNRALYQPDCVYYDKPFPEYIQELDTISVSDLRTFHQAFYGPKGTILSVVGDIEPADVLARIGSVFGDWMGPAIAEVKMPSIALPASPARIGIPVADKANVDIVIGQPVELHRLAPDFFPARFANAALGQDTLSSRLGKLVRIKHGLTYGIHSYFDNVTYPGAPWLIELSVNPENVEQALALVTEAVTQYVEDGITEEELSVEQSFAAGTFQVGLRTSLGVASTLAQFEYFGLGPQAMDRYPADIKAVTRDQVNQAIRRYINLDKAVTVLSGTLS